MYSVPKPWPTLSPTSAPAQPKATVRLCMCMLHASIDTDKTNKQCAPKLPVPVQILSEGKPTDQSTHPLFNSPVCTNLHVLAFLSPRTNFLVFTGVHVGSYEVFVGNSASNTKTVTIPAGLPCPTVVSKANWAGSWPSIPQYGDRCSIQHSIEPPMV